MASSACIEVRDRELVQIVDGALAEAARKSGAWLVCRKGCTQCCTGAFPINAVDVYRLQRGLADLEDCDPERAARVRERARQTIERLSATFPGDPTTGLLNADRDEEAFAQFANDEPCPVLDLTTGACDLYDARPMICRVFGPPIRGACESLGVCELCFQGATDDEIAACALDLDTADLEEDLLRQIGDSGETTVAFSFISRR